MRHALLLSVVVLLSGIANPLAQAAVIQIDSQTYHVSGSAESIGGSFLQFTKTEAFAVSGYKTSNGSDGYQVTDGYAYASSKDYEVKTTTQSFYGGSGDAHAEATWVFHPLSTSLMLTFTSTINRFGATEATLTDNTTTAALLNKTYGTGTFTEDHSFQVDPGHQYTLWIKASSSTTSGTDNPKLSLVITPEPSAMLVTAFGLVLGLRRKRAG
jgi:hypothetical protein